MANATQVGAIRVDASLESGKFVDGAKKIKLAAKDTEASVKKSFGGMQSAIGGSLGALKAGAAGFVAALSVGMFTRVIGNALKYASSLKDVSERLGVTTKDLQTLRYAAQQNGITTDQLDNGLEKLTVTLGKVAAGATAPTKALQAIGITAEQLKGKDTGEAFRIIADGLSKIEDRSQRAAVEVALFGETGAKLDTLLAGGSARVNELAAAAEALGIVLSDEQIDKADETADKLDALKTVLQARIAGVVADNADAILGLADAFDTLVSSVVSAVRAYKAGVAQLEIWGGRLQAYDPTNSAAGRAEGRLRIAVGESTMRDLANQARGGSSAEERAARFRNAMTGGTPARTSSGNIDQFLAPKARSGGRKRTPRAPKDTSLRDAFQFESEMRRAEMDVLRALQSLSTDYIERSNIAIQLLDLEKKAYESELKYEVAAKEKTQAQADQLLAEYDKKDALERQAVLADREAQRAEDSARLDDLTLSLERDRAESEAQLADSASEERAVRLRLLDLAYRQERARLETILADEQASFAAKEEARRRLANLNQTEGNDRQAVIDGTRGPMEEWAYQFGDITDELEDLKVRGIMGAVDAVASLSEGFDSFKDAAVNAIQQVLAELIRLQLMKLAVNLIGSASGAPSAGAFFGGGAPLSFAGGGGFNIKGRPGIDRNVLSLNGLPVANVSYGERVSVSNDNGSGGRGGDNFHFSFPGITNAREARRSGLQAAHAFRAEVARSAKANG